mgnify:CR=1 FL=1
MFDAPIEIRREASANSSESPIAIKTWLGLGTPALQAEPAEALIPSESNKSSNASLSVPGIEIFMIPGSAGSTGELIWISGITLCNCDNMWSRNARIFLKFASRSATAALAPAAKETMAGAFKVPLLIVASVFTVFAMELKVFNEIII